MEVGICLLQVLIDSNENAIRESLQARRMTMMGRLEGEDLT